MFILLIDIVSLMFKMNFIFQIDLSSYAVMK